MSAGAAIRTATRQDAATLAALYVDSWNAGFGDRMPPRKLDPELIARWRADLSRPVPMRWWVAARGGAVVGFAGIGPSRDPIDASLGELDTIAVAPPHWRSGVGRELMQHALRHLAADGYRAAVLWTLADYALGSAFYASMGWIPDGTTRADGRQIRFTHSLSERGK